METTQPSLSTYQAKHPWMENYDSVSRVPSISERFCFQVQKHWLIYYEHGTGNFILSKTFVVGGYEWEILYYPRGETKEVSDYMSLFLQLKSTSGKARTKFSFSLQDYVTGQAAHMTSTSHTFESSANISGFPRFLLIKTFLASGCLHEDGDLTIICDLTVIEEPETYWAPDPIDSPSNIHQQLESLMLRKKGFDITIEVGGKKIQAHKAVLAASSPVFEAQIFGQTKEAKVNKIKITDMEALVFEFMLWFIYNDRVPHVITHNSEKATIITQHLLVAADRYMVERLRIMCEQELCRRLDVSNVSTTLALAEQHNLANLKSQCLRYLSSKVALGCTVKTDGFEHLLKSCPSVVKEIINNINT